MKISWRFLCVIACVVIGISAFLPYFSMSEAGITISRSARDGIGWVFILIIAVAAVIFIILKKYLIVFLLGIGSLVMFFIENGSSISIPGTGVSITTRSLMHYSIGYYLLLIGSIALIIFSLLALFGKKTEPKPGITGRKPTR